MAIYEKFKKLNEKVTEASKDVTFRNWFPLILYILSFIVIDLFLLNTVLDEKYDDVFMNLYRIQYSYIIFFCTVIFMFGKKTSAIVYAVSSVLFIVYGFAQMCYSSANNDLFRIKSIFSAKEGAKFAGGLVKGVSIGKIIIFILIVVMVAAVTFLTLKFSKSPQKGFARKFKVAVAVIILAASGAYIAYYPELLSDGETATYGSFDKYNYENLVDNTALYNNADLVMFSGRDVVCTIKQKFLSNNNLEMVDEFFENKAEHKDNEMTGIFKGKNLVIVMMESMDYLAIGEDNCPNITKLMKESINFENFYSCRFGDTYTFGTETAINTGLFAPYGVNLAFDFTENSFPYSLARLFKAQGYAANEFHFNTPDFYNRGTMHSVYGYDNYIRYADYAQDKNQMFELDQTLVTDDGLYSKFTENDKFLNFVVTYSAHLPYTSDDAVYLEAVKRHPQLKAEDENDALQILRAKAALTDDFVGSLIERMEQDGTLDNTVIWFITDHYCSQVREYTLADGTYSNTPSFIYAKDIEPQTVEKVCNTSDVLPTIVNLFDIGDCENYMGSDIFDDEYEGYALFQNLSWINNDYYYNNGKIEENYIDEQPDEEYIEYMNDLVKNRIDVNNSILYNDYYKNKFDQ